MASFLYENHRISQLNIGLSSQIWMHFGTKPFFDILSMILAKVVHVLFLTFGTVIYRLKYWCFRTKQLEVIWMDLALVEKNVLDLVLELVLHRMQISDTTSKLQREGCFRLNYNESINAFSNKMFQFLLVCSHWTFYQIEFDNFTCSVFCFMFTSNRFFYD